MNTPEITIETVLSKVAAKKGKGTKVAKVEQTISTPELQIVKPEVEKQTIKFVFYQLDKDGNRSFSMPNEFEIDKDATPGSIAYWLLRPLAVMLKRKTELDLEYSKIKGNTKKAKLPFSTGRECHFGLTYKGKQIHTHSIQDVGGIQYFSNIKVSGKNPLQNAHVALVEALKVVIDTTKLDTEAKIQKAMTAIDSLSNGLMEAKESAKKILKEGSKKDSTKVKATSK